jgi:hypothetical protein|eukprot:881209-Prymnesium_polylepis.1
MVAFGVSDHNAVNIYGNPNEWSPAECGHKINDPKGSGREANCIECTLAGGAVTAIMATSAVKKGEELLIGYRSGFWVDTA